MSIWIALNNLQVLQLMCAYVCVSELLNHNGMASLSIASFISEININ